MADRYDPMKDPAKHVAPEKTLVDKVIELALGAGGGAVTLLSGLLAAVLIMYSGYVLYDTFATERAASSNAWDLLQFKPEIFDEDYEVPLSGADLSEINKDYRAWLTVYDTDIDYPVVQGQNDTYYAAVDIYGRPSLTGAIYLAAANSPDFSDSYNVIYGHHMDSGAMFGALDRMTGNETGVIVTKDEIYDVRFFAVVSTDAYENQIYSVGNRMNEVLAFLRSGGQGGVGVGTNVLYFEENLLQDATKIVALSTCANANTSGRLVVFGVMTKRVVTTDVTVVKVWDDADNQDGIRPSSLTVTLSNGETAELNEENTWTATLTVPKFDSRGGINYTWTEEETAGYELTNIVFDKETNTTTLTNHHTPETVSVSVSKVWDDDDDRDRVRPASVTAVLSNGQTVTLNDENEWKAEIDGLPKYAAGQEIEYTWTEENVEHYELTVDGSVLTNTHHPATTSLSVTKIWDDHDDQDGIRPGSLKVTLYGNDMEVGFVTLTGDGGWTGTIGDLYVNEAGVPITYRWEEETPGGYTLTGTTVNGASTSLTNTHVPETVNVTVTKVWDDHNNQDGIRPRNLTVHLSSGQRVNLNESNGWHAEISGLPRYSAGQKIEYIWTEDETRGYEQTGSATAESSLTPAEGSTVTAEYSTVITNRHETDTTVATVIKVWDDDGNRDHVRPEKLTVTLSDGQQVTLNAENSWTATVEGLPVNAAGQPITYTWAEENVSPSYTLTKTDISGTTTTLTNSHDITTVDLTVIKEWDDADNQDGKRPASVQVTLNADGEPVKDMTFTLSEDNGWTMIVTGLPVYADGTPISYTWTEAQVDGYETPELTVDDTGTRTTVINRRIPETTALTVRKEWDDADNQDGRRPVSVQVTLDANGEPVKDMTFTLSEDNSWTVKVTGLPVYSDGTPISYAWTETPVDGYEAPEITADENETGTIVTNRRVPETAALTVRKIWVDDNNRDNLRPAQLKISLLADGEEIFERTLNDNNNWTATVSDLPVYRDGGIQIAYTWSEEDLSEYGYALTNTAYDADTKTTSLTNSHSPAMTTQTVRKVWEDDKNRDGLRPESLIMTLKGSDETKRELTLNEENGWSASIEVPVYNHGETITYTWEEASVSGYSGGQETDETTHITTFINTHLPAVTERTIRKVWNDADDQDGLRPETLTVSLMAGKNPVQKIILGEENDWTATVQNLYVYEAGQTVVYSWEEESVTGYPASNSSVSGTVTTLTNIHEPETAALTVKKVWDDAENQDGMRPESVTVTLLANGEAALLADGQPAGSLELSPENGWTGAIENLPVYAAGGRIAYTWDEGEVEGYSPTFSAEAGTTIIITNTHETERTVATVVKVWDDDDDRDGVRPESLTVTLSTGDQVVLNADNQWTATVENLPKFRNGEEIVYTWTEDKPEGYELVNTAVEGTVTTLTNHHDIALQNLTVVKVWDDGDNQDGIRPARLEATLNGSQTVLLSAANNWTATIEDQPIYANGGRVIIYRWTEEAVAGYTLTRETEGTVTTLTNTHAPETVDLTVRKVWVDENTSGRPNTLNMVLTGTNGERRTVRLSAANRWTATVTGLARYDDGEEVTYTWTEPDVPGYEQTALVTDEMTATFTNTRIDPIYTLTVNYVFVNGGTAAPTVTERHYQGEEYDVVSPEIEGYRTETLRVAGMMPGRNVEYTVIYVPDDYIIITDLDTPLGLGDGQVFLNIDDCLD